MTSVAHFVSPIRSRERARLQGGRPFSFSDLDTLLGLHSGAARRRRLLVVGLEGGSTTAGTPFRRGDRLIVEPGAAMPLARFVACRLGRASVAIYATRLARTGDVALFPSDPDALPLPPAPSDLIGVVVGATRHSAAGELVARAPGYVFTPSSRIGDGAKRGDASKIAVILEQLQTIAVDLERHSPADARAVRAGAFRIRTLNRCMAAVGNDRLYTALVGEVNSTLLALARRTASTRAARILRDCLLDPAPIRSEIADRVTHSAKNSIDTRKLQVL